jgi:hypothetical protein
MTYNDFKELLTIAIIFMKYSKMMYYLIDFYFWCINATFNNILAISWRPVLVVEEAGVPGEIHQPWASNPKIKINQILKNTNNKSICLTFICRTVI